MPNPASGSEHSSPGNTLHAGNGDMRSVKLILVLNYQKYKRSQHAETLFGNVDECKVVVAVSAESWITGDSPAGRIVLLLFAFTQPVNFRQLNNVACCIKNLASCACSAVSACGFLDKSVTH